LGEQKVKTFLEALKLVHGEPKRAKKFLQDKRLSTAEKKILNAWYLLKNCQHKTIIDELSGIQSENELVESQKKLILGLAYNNMGKFKMAASTLHAAFEQLEKYPLNDHHFICIYNLFIINYNQSNETQMANCLSILDLLVKNGVNERQYVCYQQCQFNYFTFKENYQAAGDVLQFLEKNCDKMSEAMIMAHLISKFVYHLKQDHFTKSQEVIAEMKDFRLFRHSPNYLYMKLTLDHIMYDEPLYFYEKDFKESHFLFLQLKTIQALEESNLRNAEEYWKKLMAIDPECYQAGFQFIGQKNLLTICLKKHESVMIGFKIETSNSKNHAAALVEILESSTIPIPKDLLFEKIWGKKPQDQSDDEKIKNLIYYVRKMKGIEVKFRKGCYSLSPKKSKTEVA
jgi:tetratricopeptide (TPR) repeat protein